MNIIILTSSEHRHTFFRKYLALQESFQVIKTFSETQVSNIHKLVETGDKNRYRSKHLSTRTQVELDFFEVFNEKAPDKSNNTFIEKGEINNDHIVDEIINLNPDLVLSYGCSIIKDILISAFPNRFINIHLGLSPYYMGAGTNYWPFVNNEPEYAGVTFMYIDEGIDTGDVIHQMRPVIDPLDNIHQIGNRLIKDMTKTCVSLVQNYEKLRPLNHPVDFKFQQKYYKTKDFTEESVQKMLNNFDNKMLSSYLSQKERRDNAVPILTNQQLKQLV